MQLQILLVPAGAANSSAGVVPDQSQKFATHIADNCKDCGASKDKIDAGGTCTECGASCLVKDRDSFVQTASANLLVVSDIGRHHRRNEDFGQVTDVVINNHRFRFVVISDGVSSSDSGDLASQLACEAVHKALIAALSANSADVGAAISSAVLAAEAAVVAIPRQEPEQPAPAQATLVVAVLVASDIHVGWVGDSRAYAIVKDKQVPAKLTVEMLTRDDSWINILLDQGKSMDDALNDRLAHAITQSLGVLERDEVLKPNLATFSLDNLVCLFCVSDGAWNYLHPRQDQPAVRFGELFAQAHEDALPFAQSVINVANAEGGIDNITCAVFTTESKE